MKLINKVLGIVFLVLGLANAASAAIFVLSEYDSSKNWNPKKYESLGYEEEGLNLTVSAKGPLAAPDKERGLRVTKGLLFTFDEPVSQYSIEFDSNGSFDYQVTETTILVTAKKGNHYIKSITATAMPSVPVPSTVFLLGAGLVGLVGFRKQATA